MTDLMDRLEAANPAHEDARPPLDEVWRKIEADTAVPERSPWRRHGRRMVLIAGAAVPVIAVVLVAISARGVRHAPSHRPATSGHHARSTIVPALQRSALRALGSRPGSVVVINPRTGAIEAMAASGGLRGGARAAVAPGATFDVVTLATALGSGRYGPDSRVSGASPFTAGGAPVRNAEGQSFGRLTLSQALMLSVDTVFARVGTDVGAGALARQMRLFALPSQPGRGGTLAVGPLAAGQGTVTATPVQLAAIAASIANGGRLAQPHAAELDGPVPLRTVMPPRTARLLTQMLRTVVTQGTASAVNLPGLNIAGKTGTAPAGSSGGSGGAGGAHATVASFIGFAPADHPSVAIAVVITSPHGGFGGTEAAPVAGRVIRDALALRAIR